MLLLHFHPPGLLNRHRRLRTVDGDRLQARVPSSAASDREGRLPGSLRHKGYRDHRSLARDSSRTTRTGNGDLRLAKGFIFPVNQSDDLAVLGKKTAIRHVYQLQ